MKKEKRRFARVPAEHLIAFSCFHAGENVPFDHSMGKTVNVGEGGLMLYVYKSLRKGTLLDLDIALKDKIINAKVEVLRARKKPSNGNGYFASTRFVMIDHRDYQRMMEYDGVFPVKKAGNMN